MRQGVRRHRPSLLGQQVHFLLFVINEYFYSNKRNLCQVQTLMILDECRVGLACGDAGHAFEVLGRDQSTTHIHSM
jgi:hypothetical protein